MEQDPQGFPPLQGAGVASLPPPVIVNGLLCSIFRALTRNPVRKELAFVINRDSSEPLIKEAWNLLFTFYSEAVDKVQRKRIIEITRESTLKLVEDIIVQLDQFGKQDVKLVTLLMPWDYSVKEFETDSEYRAKLWEDEKNREGALKLSDLEQKLEKKHNDLIAHLDRWSTSIANLVNNRNSSANYANVVASNNSSAGPYSFSGFL